eukprot:9502080-Pyramimonas_sp.AAC.2
MQRQKRADIAYKPGRDKIIYVKGEDTSRLYLIALLRAKDHGQPVQPSRTAEYYTWILEGKEWHEQKRS